MKWCSIRQRSKLMMIITFRYNDLLWCYKLLFGDNCLENRAEIRKIVSSVFLLNSLSPGRFDMFLKHRLNHVSCVNYYQNQFHQMREELKLENGLSVSLFELCVSQNRKITSMAVKKERLITDVITCVFLNKTFFFSIMEMQLCGIDGILSSTIAQL